MAITTLEAYRASGNRITSAVVEVPAEERNSALLLLPPASLADLPSREDPLGRLASRESGFKQEDNGDVAKAGRDVAPPGVRCQMNVQEYVLDLALLQDERGVRFQILALLCEQEAAYQGILEAFRFRHVTQKEAKY